MFFTEILMIYQDLIFSADDGPLQQQRLLMSSVSASAAAATPSAEGAMVDTKPLTKENLVGFFKSGCKPKDLWRIGTEHEKFGFDLGTLLPMNYEQVANLLSSIAERFGWDREMEDNKIIGLKQGLKSVTLEPGGQLELSGAPLETLHQTCSEFNSHLYHVINVGEELGIRFLGVGFQPKWQHEGIPLMPKAKYEIMRNLYPEPGSAELNVLFRTCTIQVNLDYGSEADMIRKFRASIALQPIAVALFANSPFKEGKPSGYLSTRSAYRCNCDKSRTGMIPFVFDDSFGFERYVDYALDVPMFFVYRNKKLVDCSGMSFRDFMKGKLPALPGELPTLFDWEMHLGFLYPEARLKKYIEMRGADAGPSWALNALPAFWVGLLYDEVSLQSVLDMIADWTEEERDRLRNEVPILGLKTPFREGCVKEVAEYVVKLAIDGLERRGVNEAGFLNELAEVARTGVTQAERLLERYYGAWGCNVDGLFQELHY